MILQKRWHFTNNVPPAHAQHVYHSPTLSNWWYKKSIANNWCSVKSCNLLKDCSIWQIEFEWVSPISHPAESWFDKFRQHASLVKYDNGLDSSWMRAKTHYFISRWIRMACFCNWLEHFWYFSLSEIFDNAMLIHKDTHELGIRLTKSLGLEEDLICWPDWTNMRMYLSKGNVIDCPFCQFFCILIVFFNFLGYSRIKLGSLPAHLHTDGYIPSNKCVVISLLFSS